MPKEVNFLKKRLLKKFIAHNNININKVELSLKETMEHKGVLAVSLIDWQSGIVLGELSHKSLNMKSMTAENISMIRKAIAMSKSLNINSVYPLKDIVTFDQNHIQVTTYTNMNSDREFFLFVLLDAAKTNLALEQSHIQEIVKKLTV